MLLANGSSNVTTYFVLRDATTHAPKTDVTITDIDLYYVEQGSAISDKIDATALAAADSDHADGKAFNVGQGLYRIDWPDAAFDGGIGTKVQLVVVCTGVDTEYLDVELTLSGSAGVAAGAGTDYGFCTLAQLKLKLGIADTENDTILQQVINDAAAMIESVAGRRLRRDTSRVEYFNGGSSLIYATMLPIVSVASIRESETWDFTTAGAYTELVDKTDYILLPGLDLGHKRQVLGGSGLIRRIGNRWLGDAGEDGGKIQVTYTAGYYPAESVPSPDDGFSTPFDLRNANLIQAANEWQSRKSPGMISQAMRGVAASSGASFLKKQSDLLPEVLRVALAYRRLV